MSDWSLCELEQHLDWNEFCTSEDHIVPHPVRKPAVDPSVLCDSNKKLKHTIENDAGKIKCNTNSSISTVPWVKEDLSFSTMKNGSSSIIEGPLSCPSGILVPAICYSENNAISVMASEARISDCFITGHNNGILSNKFFTKYPIFGTSISTNNSKSWHSSVNGVSLDVTGLSLDNEQDRQSDLFYNDWSAIDNFEDVDKMFRTWDSTFGEEHTGTADELSWFSSSPTTIYASEIAFEPGLESLNSELGTLYGKGEHQCLNTNILHKNIPVPAEHFSSGNRSYADLLDTGAEDKSKFAAEEVLWDGGEIKTLGLVHISNNNGLNGCGNSNMMECQLSSQEKGTKRSADAMFLDTDVVAPQMCTSKQFSQQKHFIDSTTASFMQNLDSDGQMEYDLPAHQLQITQVTSCTEFEDDNMPCSSIKDSDHLVNCEAQCFEMRPDQFYRPQTMTEENLEKVKQRKQSSNKMIVEHLDQQDGLRSKKKQLEARAGIEQEDIGLGLPTAEINSVVACESSCIASSVSDDISFKATSFLQLQDVMHKLDARIKLCIRDGLYRLARSAHQRHGFSHKNSSFEANVADASKSADPMDNETNTNPIDRSVAHLLFHKTSEPAARARLVDDATSFGSRVTNEQPRVRVSNQNDRRIFSDCTDMDFLHSDLM